MINFDTLRLAVYMAQDFRAGRYGFILYNPEFEEFGLMGPFMKSEKYKFTPNAASYTYIIVDNKIGTYHEVKTMFEMGLFKSVDLNKVYGY